MLNFLAVFLRQHKNLSSILLPGTDYALNLPRNAWRDLRWICYAIAALSALLPRFFVAMLRMRTSTPTRLHQRIVAICVDSITPRATELASVERSGVHIHGLLDALEIDEVKATLDQNFERIQNIMFSRTNHLAATGSGPAEVEDDGYD